MAIGKAEVERNRMAAARTAFERIRSDLPGSNAKQALVDLALVAVKQNRDADALALWDQISSQYPDDEVTKDAFLIGGAVARRAADNWTTCPMWWACPRTTLQKRPSLPLGLGPPDNANPAIPQLTQFIERHPNSKRVLVLRASTSVSANSSKMTRDEAPCASGRPPR